jgi:hypothetical protein
LRYDFLNAQKILIFNKNHCQKRVEFNLAIKNLEFTMKKIGDYRKLLGVEKIPA